MKKPPFSYGFSMIFHHHWARFEVGLLGLRSLWLILAPSEQRPGCAGLGTFFTRICMENIIFNGTTMEQLWKTMEHTIFNGETMEHHHFYWENSLFLWTFPMVKLVTTRG